MAELDPQPVEPIETPEPDETVVVVETVHPKRPRKVYSGMWGVPEIAAVAVGALVLAGVLALYLAVVVPSNRELTRNKAEADRLDAELISARSKYGEIRDTQGQVDKIVASVDDFETRFLPLQTNGQAALYQRLNGLIGAYGLVNTTGPDYQPLEAADLNKPNQQQTDDDKGRGKYRSLYPGVYVTTTVEGTYQNLRRFIREIETGREFVVISAVELAPSDTEGQKNEQSPGQAAAPGPIGKPLARPPVGVAPMPVQSQPSSSKGKMHGEVVALHIEMAAYFRRPDSVSMVGQQ
jgi:hypothetical protein